MNREQELSVLSQGGKRIDVLVINPETLDGDTGLMLIPILSLGDQTLLLCTGHKYVIDFSDELPQLREEKE